MNPGMFSPRCLFLSILFVSLHPAWSQTSVDPELLAAIEHIRGIDNHAHVLPARNPDSAEGERPDPFGKPPFDYPVRLRVSNPEYVKAWRALYGYRYQDMTADHAREALKAKLRLMQEKGSDYPSWVLDKAGLEIVLVNMPQLGAGLNAPRFLRVPYADGLLFPFHTDNARIEWFRKTLGLDSLPANLSAHMETIRTLLKRWNAAGAIAIKFAIAYVRPIDIARVSADEANRAFELCRQNGRISPGDDRILQDFLFRFISTEAGELGLAVHIHTGIGADPYFNIGGSNPMLLEAVFNDPMLRRTNFVMLHGGWPFEHEAGAMLIKPNVYADFSAQTFLRSTDALSRVLREWLEWYPEKILFGTDSYSDDTPLAGWEEKLWLATRTSREALALALTQMMKAGEISRQRAEELARMVLRGNAAKLYKLEKN